MKSLWAEHKKKILIALAVAVVVVGAAGAWYLGTRPADEPQEITSAWPSAQSERVIEQPEEPVRWPLTGEDATSPEEPANTRVLSVKIENSPSARPQSGLDHADIIYESLTEGGITRFNALFHSRVPEIIGPVRSARMSDTQIIPQYSALFAHSGANTGVLSRIRDAGLEVVDHSSAPAAYRRVSFRSAPHNLYLDPVRVREIGVSRGYSATQELKGLQFSSSVDSDQAATGLTVPFSPANRVTWDYDANSGLYLRSNNGQAHLDRESGARYSARNVVVLWAQTSATGPARTLEIALVGEGEAAIFRDGVRIDGTWSAGASAPPVLRDSEGSLIRLAPGNTWFQVVPPDVSIDVR